MAEETHKGKPSRTRFPKQFLKAIFGNDLLERNLELEIRCIPANSNKPVIRRFYNSLSKLKRAWKEVRRLSRQHYDVYFAVLPRDPETDHKLPKNLVATCLWVDIDVGPDKPNKSVQDALKLLRKFAIKPTIVVKSGHGIHAYWCLKDSTTIDAQRAKRFLRSLAKATGGDLQSAEVARLLRMPGTPNWKSRRHPKLCQVVKLNRSRRFRLRDFKKTLGPSAGEIRRKKSKRPQDYFDFFAVHVRSLHKTSDTQAIGLCPFHSDANPSWSLRTTDGVWHCFGCGTAGNAVSFCHLRHIDLSECPDEESVLEQRSIAIDGGGYAIWKCTGEGWRKIRISNFVIDWELENRVSDRIRLEDRIFSGKIVTQKTKVLAIRLGNDEFCSNQTFYTALVREAD